MLKVTDVLSVHIPLSKETEGFVGEKEIRLLKEGSVIINTARGKVIDEEAMIRALADGHVQTFIAPNSADSNNVYSLDLWAWTSTQTNPTSTHSCSNSRS